MSDFFAKMAFNGQIRMRTWRKLSAQIRSNLSLEESLRILRAQAQNRKSPLAAVFENALAHIGAGHSLGTAFSDYATAEEIMLIKAGQKSGTLSESLRLAKNLLEARRKISGAVIGALAYPVFLMALCIVMLVVVAVYVIPQLAVLSDPRLWTGAAGALYAVSSFINSWLGILFFILLAALCAGALIALPLWTGPVRQRLENIPPWSMYRLTVSCTWMLTLATLMRSNVQLKEILADMLSSDTVSPYLQERIQAIAEQCGMGKNLGDAMYDAGMSFPDDDLIDDLKAYAELPGFQDRIYTLAQEWMEDGVALIQRKARILNISFMVLIIIQVIGLALAVISLQSQLLPQGGI